MFDRTFPSFYKKTNQNYRLYPIHLPSHNTFILNKKPRWTILSLLQLLLESVEIIVQNFFENNETNEINGGNGYIRRIARIVRKSVGFSRRRILFPRSI